MTVIIIFCLGTTSIQNDGIPATCINDVIMVPSSSAGRVRKCEQIHINFIVAYANLVFIIYYFIVVQHSS